MTQEEPKLQIDSLFVEFDADSVEQANEKVRAVFMRQGFPLESGSAGGWQISETLVDPKTPGRFGVEVTAPEEENMPPGRAWTAAHALATELQSIGAVNVHVEPTFKGDFEFPTSQSGEESSSDGTPDPPNDVRWHFNNIRVEAAHQFFDDLPRNPGQDVLIGHPDTGYTEHKEIFGGDPNPIFVEKGFNLLENNDDPTDPLEDGFAEHPGHGTSTSSAMVSRAGVTVPRLDNGETADLLGVATAARVAPFRVNESVIIVWWQRRLAKAIELAVDRGCRVISVSLGGLGGRRLNRAINYAESNGVIVVAAAGNEVGFVVAPATNPLTVACAASDVNNDPWSGSSAGRAVNITAPGHQVWIAGWTGDGRAVAQPGSGTSYATAIVAASAALWISAHHEQLEPKKAETARLFRLALQASAQRLPDQLPSHKFGAGLLDCKKLLATAPDDVGGDEESLEEFGSPDSIALKSLLGEPDDQSEAISGSESNAIAQQLDPMSQGELVFHLTVNPRLRSEWMGIDEKSKESPSDSPATIPDCSQYSSRLRTELRRIGAASRLEPSMDPQGSSPGPGLPSHEQGQLTTIEYDSTTHSADGEIVVRLNLNITIDVEHD